MKPLMPVGPALAKALEIRGLPKIEAARQIGCDRTAIHYWINGQRTPSLLTENWLRACIARWLAEAGQPDALEDWHNQPTLEGLEDVDTVNAAP